MAQTVLVDKAAVKDLICCLKKRVEDKHCLHEKGLDANIGLKSFLKENSYFDTSEFSRVITVN